MSAAALGAAASSGWNIVRLDEVAASPWRNGGGVTRELLAWPLAADWRVRMSVAEVEQDGPFSRFEGVQRWFAVLQGAGVRLRLEGAEHALTRASAAFAFDGGAALDCELLDGPTQDFNLMLRGAGGRMEKVRGALSSNCSATHLIAVYCHSARAMAHLPNEKTVLEPRTLAWRILDADSAVRIESADALWMEIER
jgi:hypothetical protein